MLNSLIYNPLYRMVGGKDLLHFELKHHKHIHGVFLLLDGIYIWYLCNPTTLDKHLVLFLYVQAAKVVALIYL